jgi:hypothetical protein
LCTKGTVPVRYVPYRTWYGIYQVLVHALELLRTIRRSTTVCTYVARLCNYERADCELRQHNNNESSCHSKHRNDERSCTCHNFLAHRRHDLSPGEYVVGVFSTLKPSDDLMGFPDRVIVGKQRHRVVVDDSFDSTTPFTFSPKCCSKSVQRFANSPGSLLSLQYANRAATSVRSALKEPARSKLMAQGEFSYKASSWTAGSQGAKTEVTTLGAAGKAL